MPFCALGVLVGPRQTAGEGNPFTLTPGQAVLKQPLPRCAWPSMKTTFTILFLRSESVWACVEERATEHRPSPRHSDGRVSAQRFPVCA